MKTVRPSIRVWLAVAAVVTAVAFLLSYRGIRQSEASTAAVEHTRHTLSSLAALEGAIADLIFASGHDVSAREMAKVVLEYCGASVRSAASAAEARNALAQSGYDVLLVDIAMPGEDGYTFIRSLRNDGLQQPAAALTALAHETDRVRALESGFDIHIQKPVEPRALAKAVAALVSTRAGAS